MIPARKNPAFNFALRRWMTRLLRRRFHGMRLCGGEHLRALAASGQPVIGCVNHTNWWDGFVLYVLSHRLLPHDIYLAMEEKNLRRYRFFTWMGVFGLDLSNRAAAVSGLRYAVRLLGSKILPSRLIWMFVQGALVNPRRPVEVKPGALFLVRRTGAMLLPLVLRYDWLLESRPGVFVKVGAPMPSETTPEALAERLNGLLKQVDEALETNQFSGWEDLLPARMSINKRWDYFLHLLSGRRAAFERQNG